MDPWYLATNIKSIRTKARPAQPVQPFKIDSLEQEYAKLLFTDPTLPVTAVVFMSGWMWHQRKLIHVMVGSILQWAPTQCKFIQIPLDLHHWTNLHSSQDGVFEPAPRHFRRPRCQSQPWCNVDRQMRTFWRLWLHHSTYPYFTYLCDSVWLGFH